jgi:hypothetical protein
MISPTFCPLPFNHIFIHPTSRAGVCCAYSRGYNDKDKTQHGGKFLPLIGEYDNLEDHLKHPYIKDVQQKMLAGEKVFGCDRCYFEEEHGIQSLRQKELEQLNSPWGYDSIIPNLTNPKLNYIEVTFGNFCNLACRTCNSELSHSWIEDNELLKQHGLKSYSTTERLNLGRDWKEDDFKDLEYLKISGGEPMLHTDWFKFIDKIEPSNIEMFIFTNASWIPKQRHLDILQKFKRCQIFLSIDGTGTVQEYMRHNAKWDITEKSVRKWMEWSTTVDNVQVSWAPTWSLMNANYYIETCNWWLGLTEELLRGTSGESWILVKTNFIFGPPIYQMSLLSNKEELKQKAKDYIEELNDSDITRVEHIIEMTEAYIKFFDKDANSVEKPVFSKPIPSGVTAATVIEGYIKTRS